MSQKPRIEKEYSKRQIARAAAHWEAKARRYGAALMAIHHHFSENDSLTRELWQQWTTEPVEETTNGEEKG